MKVTFNLMGLLLFFSPWHLQALSFSMQDLGTLSTNQSVATGINNQCVIVGNMRDASEGRDFLWRQETGLTLLPFTSTYQFPLINNHNQIVSLFWHKTNYWLSENTTSKHIYLADGQGSLRDLGAPKKWKMQELSSWQTPAYWDEKELAILDFNDQGQILLANSAKNATAYAIWQKGDFTYLDPSILSNAYEINNQGLVLGRRWVKDEHGKTIPMLVLYDFKQGTTCDIMKDTNLISHRLNDRGQVAVIYEIASQNKMKGFLWDQEKGLIALEDFAPTALNNCNQMVGMQISKRQQDSVAALLWDNGTLIPLNEIVGVGGEDSLWTEIAAVTDINDKSYIIGSGVFDGKKHAFVLIPKEEPCQASE